MRAVDSTGAPEGRFAVGPITTDGETVRVSMLVGPWTSVGSLGVMIDDAVGSTVYFARPPGCHSVTTELSVDIVQPPLWRRGSLEAVARALRLDGTGGLARGVVLDELGDAVAVATARCQYVPDTTASKDVLPVQRVQPPTGQPALDLLGAQSEPGERRARVLVGRPAGLANGGGTVHGGVLFCGSDEAAAALAREDGDREQTDSIRMNFLRPASLDEVLVFTAEVVHRGRSATVSRVTSAGLSGKASSVAVVTRRCAAD